VGDHIPQGRALAEQMAREGPEFQRGRAVLQSPVRSWKSYDVISEIDIWRAATLMLKRYGDKALEQSDLRVDELTAAGDHDGADTWRRITAAVAQLANTTPPGPLH
jgi:hypothetical protein